LVRELIHRFKYRQQLFLRPLLGQLMLKANEDPRMTEMAAAEWVAVPVPLHPRRHRERGFNQAQELSRAWSKATKIPTRLAL
jgi:predicted amidophosphoribosyltransferase